MYWKIIKVDREKTNTSKKQATKWFFDLNNWRHQLCLCGKSNIWVCFWLICERDIKRIGSLPMALFLCVFLTVLLIKKIVHCCFSIDKMKNKKSVLHIAVFGYATGNILFFSFDLKLFHWMANCVWAITFAESTISVVWFMLQNYQSFLDLWKTFLPFATKCN